LSNDIIITIIIMYIYSIIVKKKKIVYLFYIYGFILEKIEPPKTCGRTVYILLESFSHLYRIANAGFLVDGLVWWDTILNCFREI